MADAKITELSALTTPQGADLLAIVDDPSGTPATKKITNADLQNGGWIEDANTWTYSSVDGATGIVTINADLTGIIQAGDRIKLTQTTAKYFIVTKTPTYATGNTTLTFWGGTGYTLANVAITSPMYSHAKDPFGFNSDPGKWTISTSYSTDTGISTAGWNNVGSISLAIHIGVWYVSYEGPAYATKTGQCGVLVGLSTANNTQGDVDLSTLVAGAATSHYGNVHRSKQLTLTSKTTYYLNMAPAFGSETAYGWKGATYGTVWVRAVCAYL